MIDLRVVSIVEGHGEVSALPLLLRRIWGLIGGGGLDILRPIRSKRNLLVSATGRELDRAVQLAAHKLTAANPPAAKELILILVDADRDLPCLLGPQLTASAQKARGDKDSVCVVANVEYETWFAAAADSLKAYLNLKRDKVMPLDPERSRQGKGWVKARFSGYSETVDQAKFTALMDLDLCRRRSPSFDKLWREIEKRK